MADKTMHHVVIGDDTFELIDKAGREETASLREDLSELDGSISLVEDAFPSNFMDVGDVTSTIDYDNVQIDYEGNVSSGNGIRVTSGYIPLGDQISVYNSNPSDSNGMCYWIRVYNASKQFIANAKFSDSDTCLVGTGTGYGVTTIQTVNLDAILQVNSNAKYVRLVIRYMESTSTPISPSDVWLTYQGLIFVGGNLDDEYANKTTTNTALTGLQTAHTMLTNKTKNEISEPMSAERMTFFDIGTNLFNGEVDTGRLDANGVLDESETDYKTSKYIYCPGNDGKYALVEKNGSLYRFSIACYDAFKNKLTAHVGGVKSAYPIADGTVYIRFSETANDFNSNIMLAISSNNVAIPHVNYVPPKLNTPVSADVVEQIGASLTGIAPKSTTFFERNHSKNLFDKTDYEVGRLSNGVVDSSNTSYFTTAYIDLAGLDGDYIVPCISSTNIGCNGYAYYDENKGFLGGYNGSSAAAIAIQPGARYFRFSYGIRSLNSFAVFVNDTGTAYDTKTYYDYWQVPFKKVNLQNWYTGKFAAALGDSITANGNLSSITHSGWRSFVAEEMHFSEEIYNCGIGGTRVSGSGTNAMWQDVRINSIPTDIDILFFNGGMNDWGGNATLGDEDSTDTDTFYGALNTIVQKLMNRIPNALIIFMTTTFGENADGIKNTQNLTCYDYGRAIKKVAEKNGFPCVDLHALCGWNHYNEATYVNNDGTVEAPIYIHPNREGGKKMTTAICSVLRGYQPFVS